MKDLLFYFMYAMSARPEIFTIFLYIGVSYCRYSRRLSVKNPISRQFSWIFSGITVLRDARYVMRTFGDVHDDFKGKISEKQLRRVPPPHSRVSLPD